MTTQLHLVEPPDAISGADAASRSARSRSGSSARTSGHTATRSATRVSARSSGRRAARWGDWQLDSRTRRVGRAGVAAAREALERAATEQERERAARGSDGQRLAS